MKVSGINDYGFLFNSYSNSSKGSSDLLGNVSLTDYKNIKTGGYGKLLKSYYSMEKVDAKESPSVTASTDTKKSTHKTNFLDSIAPATSKETKDTKSVNFLDTIVPKTVKTDNKVSEVETKTKETEKEEEQPVVDTSKLLYTVNGGYGDASSVLAGNFFNTGA